MPSKPLASNQLKRKQLPEQEECSEDENGQFNDQSSSSGDDEQPIPPPLSKHPKLSSPSSSSSTPLIRSSTSTSTSTTNATMYDSNAGNGGNGGGDGNAVLFQEMNHINSKLISLDDLFSIHADNKYFVEYQEMFDEFNENVLHFLWKVNRHRKRAAFKRLSEDALFHILQYVTKSDLVKICQWVSKMWRQQVLKQELKVDLSIYLSTFKAESLLRSEFIGRVVSLRLVNVRDELLELFACYSKSLSNLKHLYVIHWEPPKIKSVDKGLEEFLQSKVNLQYLSLQIHDLRVVPNLFTINSAVKLNSNTVIFNQLIKLDISECDLTNQMIFDIILSPKLPNLTTLIATNINQGDEITSIPTTTTNSSIVRNRSSSNLTELNMNDSFVYPLAEMIKFTPKLKKLLICNLRDRVTDDYKEVEDYSFLVHTDSKLSQLEYLEITISTALIELVFTNLMFSNLKYLNCRTQWKDIGEDEIDREVKLIEECVNLTKLERVSKTIRGDEQEVKIVQAFRNNPMFNSNQLKIEDFRYESVYPNVEKKDDNIYIS